MAVQRAGRQYGGRAVASRRSDRRARLIDAGIVVFGDVGYNGASISTLCAVAKVARSQFYEHFNNREELLLAVYDQIQLEARESVALASSVQTVELESWLRAAIAAYADAIGADPRRASISFVVIVGISDRVERHRVEQREVWARFIESELRARLGEGVEPAGGFGITVTAFIGALMALIQQWSSSSPQPPLTDLTEVLTRFLRSVID